MTIQEREQALAQLKPRTQAVYRFMATHLSLTGDLPTIRDMKAHFEQMEMLKMSSTSVVNYHLKKLEAVGLVIRHKKGTHGVELPGITARPLYRKLEQVG